MPQTGIATSGYAQATSAVASGYSAPANSAAVTSAQPASSQTFAGSSFSIASLAGKNVVLAGESPSTSAGGSTAITSSFPARPTSSVPVAASVVVGADGIAEEMSGGSSVAVTSEAPTQTSPKGCGRGGRKGPYRSAK